VSFSETTPFRDPPGAAADEEDEGKLMAFAKCDPGRPALIPYKNVCAALILIGSPGVFIYRTDYTVP
jgi:hypothetical protein